MPYIVGFESYKEDGCWAHLNFILSNGERSTFVCDRYPTKHTLMFPDGVIEKIRYVTFYYWRNECVGGFMFLDKDK